MSFTTALSLKGGLKNGLSQGQDLKKRTFESEERSMANYATDEIKQRTRSEAKPTTRKQFLKDLDDINSPSNPMKEDSRANAHSHPSVPIRFSRATYTLCKPYTKQVYTLIISKVKCVGFGLKILHKTLHCVGLRGTVCRVGMIEKRTCRVGRKKQKTPFSSHFLPFRARKCKNRRFHRTFCFNRVGGKH